MRKVALLILVLILPFCFGFLSDDVLESRFKTLVSEDNVIHDEEISIYNFEELEPFLYTESKKTHIVSFWAMWCLPCVKELPILQEYAKDNPDVDILMVSLDFPKNMETKLRPFLKKKGITSKVVLLDDPDANSWIDKIDPDWSGAIPFTIIFNSDKRSFHERAFESVQEFETEVNKTIKTN